jgi:hypothetical protein
MFFPKPKCNKRLYVSTDDFLKLIPESTSTEQAVKLLKYIQDKEHNYELKLQMNEKEKEIYVLELKLQKIEKEKELELNKIKYESEIKCKNQEIEFLTKTILSSNLACTSRGIFEYILKGVNSELNFPKNFNARNVCDKIIACKPSIILSYKLNFSSILYYSNRFKFGRYKDQRKVDKPNCGLSC